ncbi:MAG: LVIVD repeat-containing protein [Candidatus Hodarchaeota archaeon]
MRKFQLIFIFFYSILTVSIVCVSCTTSVKTTLTEVGQIDTGGDAFDVDIKNNIAYVIDLRYDGLKSIDISDPNNLEILDEFRDGGIPHELLIVEDLLYLGDHNNGLEIIDINNPNNLEEIGEFNDGGEISWFDFDSDKIYAGDGVDGLEIIDVSDPTHPFEIGQYDWEGITCVHVINDIAWLGRYNGLLKLVNVSNPDNPIEVREIELGNIARDMYSEDGRIYIACERQGLKIYDVNNPIDPVFLGQCIIDGFIMDICVEGDFVWAAEGDKGVKLINVNENSKPFVVTTYNDGGNAKGVHIVNEKIFVAESSDGLEILILESDNSSDDNSSTIPSYDLFLIIASFSSLGFLMRISGNINV